MKNLEYAVRNPSLIDESEIHPNDTGFAILYEKTLDGILNGSCEVSVETTPIVFTPVTALGPWTATPEMEYSQHNDYVSLVNKINGLMYDITTPVTFNSIDNAGSFGGYKLIKLGSMSNTPLRGGHVDGTNGKKYKVLGYIRSRLLTTSGYFLMGNVPLVMCGYDLYLGVADTNTNGGWIYEDPNHVTIIDGATTITGIYFDSFKLDINIGAMDYVN